MNEKHKETSIKEIIEKPKWRILQEGYNPPPENLKRPENPTPPPPEKKY
ncbi:MAG: hypothetical protein ABH870_02295 [bacterium]